MRRLAVSLAVLVALTLPTLAIAGGFPPDTESQGRIEGDPNTWIGYDIVKGAREHKIKNLSAIVPMHCYNGDDPTVEIDVPGSFKIHGYDLPPRVQVFPPRFFFANAEIETEVGSGEVEMYGYLRRHHRGRGQIEVETEDEILGTCYTGYLNWKVTQAAVPPPSP